MGIQRRVGASGRVTYVVTVYSPLSASKEYIGTFDRLKDAELAHADQKRRIKLGELAPRNPRYTVSELSEDWLRTANVRANTLSSYRSACKRIVARFGRTRVNAINKQDVELWVTKLNASTLAPSTVRLIVKIMGMMFSAAQEWGYIRSNPARNLRSLPRKRQYGNVRALTVAEHTALVSATAEYWKTLIFILPFTGLRRGEALGLEWADVDLQQGTLRVHQQASGGRLTTPKTSAATRTILLPYTAIESLRMWRDTSLAHDGRLVFPAEQGGIENASHFYRAVFNPATKAANLAGVTPHTLRHTFASWLIAQHADIKYIQTQMGHESAQVTLDTYGHLMDKAGTSYAALLDAWYRTHKAEAA